ncbi:MULTISPECIES: ABC transporter ATP-binding protein [unclassified Halomonas]|uniref:ABC transporter ATP-binding protein n=1 Tax=Halomonas sp. N3-2A TaxID=2014541 RepID=UPI000B5B4231|nr:MULTISPECIES: ABC transporter ATP-binding protein [unclassified Halomonas]ASK17926.1 ABC transporter ATP-binding protein [Halomonas sp. N3-2A]UTD55614.1 ABC transporter ATP-binding protein [Halomonas sp. MS1]
MIVVKDLHKSFKLFTSPRERLKEALTGKNYHTQHIALDGVSFEVAAGEVLGVLGRNGAGKSTLLKLLTGVLMPDAGSLHIDGRVTGLLELGTGFNPELSGIDNITINALMLGMSHADIERHRDAIIEFCELGDYIHEPLRTYSSGMAMRLGFAIAIHADPACFLVDEALSVGDGYFQQKCIQRIRQFKQEGGAILFVSHDLNAVKVLCDRAIVLEGGRLIYDGDSEGAVNHYNRIMAEQAEGDDLRDGESGAFGTQEVLVTHCHVQGQDSQSPMIASGEVLEIHLRLKANATLDDVALGVLLRDRYGQDVFGQNTHQHKIVFSVVEGEEREVVVRIKADIAPGKYTLSAALHSSDHHLDDCYWWHDSLDTFEVAGYRYSKFSGFCRLDCSFDMGPLV